MTNTKQVQKVYRIHDFLYASESLIPSESFDGKDEVEVRYIITEEPITEQDATENGIYIYETEEEANEILAEENE